MAIESVSGAAPASQATGTSKEQLALSKKQQEADGEVALKLVQGAAKPDGVGAKIDTFA